MADKKESADEIVDNLSEEMGVKDKKTKKKKSPDMMAGLGGIFDVGGPAPSKKKKKSEPEPEEVAEEEEAVEEEAEEEVSEPEEELVEAESEEEPEDIEESADDVVSEVEVDEEPVKPTPEAKKKAEKKPEPKKEAPKKKSSDGIDGVFNTGGADESFEFDVSDGFLDEDDLGDYEPKGRNSTTAVLVGIIAMLVLALGVVVLSLTGYGETLMLVLKGDYREYKMAEKERLEKEHEAKVMAGLERFGNLSIQGTPKYATIKLNGEIQYGQTSSGQWRAVQLIPGFANFTNLKVKQKHVIEVSAPGFDTKTFELVEGTWPKGNSPLATVSHMVTATLTPTSIESKNEFDARMGSDVETEYFGVINIKTTPPGAKILFNNAPLLDKDGKELVTPVALESYYVANDKGKLEEKKVNVDTVFDLGHKIVLSMPNQPTYATQVNRPMWTCNKLDEKALKKLPKDHSPQAECNYVYDLNLDFGALQGYIKRREEEKKKVEEQNEKIKQRQIELKGGPTMSADKK